MATLTVHGVKSVFIEPVEAAGRTVWQDIVAKTVDGQTVTFCLFYADPSMALEPCEVHYGNHRRRSCNATEGREACACD